jgi:hypothetical protein
MEVIMAEITQKQLAANRQNALKSTGPRIAEGKALVALNSIKHGLLSKEVLLANEDEAALVELGKRLRHQLAPVGELEILLVDRITAAAWRLMRILRIEREMMDHEVSDKERDRRVYSTRKKQEPVTSWDALESDFQYRDTLGKFMRYESHIERGMYKAMHELQRLQAARSGERIPALAGLTLMYPAKGIFRKGIDMVWIWKVFGLVISF